MRWRWKPEEIKDYTSDDVVRWAHWWTPTPAFLVNRVFWNTQVLGAEKIPKTGPVIVASNHTGIADGPMLYSALPRPPHIMTKSEMFDSAFSLLLQASGQFPVDRNNGRPALRIALDLLAEGRLVALFPEGRRGAGAASRLKAGVAWLAQNSGAPVVPTACLGTRPSGASVGYVPPFRSKLYVVFGNPIWLPDDLPKGRAGTARAIDIIAEGLRRHISQAEDFTGLRLPGDEGVREEGER